MLRKLILLPLLCALLLGAAMADTMVHPEVNGLVQPVCAPTSDEHTLVISMIGDCTAGEQYRYKGYKTGYTYNISRLGLDYPMRHVTQLFAEDDLTIANCEGVFTTRKLPAGAKTMSLCADPVFAQVLSYGNVDVCNLSNNHAGDFGDAGRADTMKALSAVGIEYFDNTLPWVATIKGVKIGIAATTFPLSDKKIQLLVDQLNTLKAEQGVHFTIASIHWGHEDSHTIDSQQKTYGRYMIDHGVDMVYGHGSHTLLPIQYYNGHLIFYSTSNFTFGANRTPKDPHTAVFQVTFDIGDDHTLTPRSLLCLPFRMYGLTAPNYDTGAPTGKGDFSPIPVEDEAERLEIFAKLLFKPSSGMDSGLPESFAATGYAQLR